MNDEVWLKTNRRASLFLAILPVTGMLLSVVWLIFAGSSLSRWLGVAVLASMAIWIVFVVCRIRQPRLAYRDGNLLVYLHGGQPTRVPIEAVECFFLGQGPSMLPRSLEGKHGEAAETATVIVRLAESAKEWHHREVRPSLGQWCEGYITIRGTWCEPLTGDLVIHLNRRLLEAHRFARQTANETVSA